MKQIALASALFLLGSIAPGMAHAESIQKANQKDVARLLKAATCLNSAYLAYLIGETPDRIYIEYRTGIHASSFLSNKTKYVVYWLPRSGITDQQLTHFRKYRDECRIVWMEHQQQVKKP